jgi:hypothetical protein
MGERALPALKVSELHIFARKVRIQLLAAQLGRFGQHPSLLLDNPLTHAEIVRGRQRKATRLLQPPRQVLLSNETVEPFEHPYAGFGLRLEHSALVHFPRAWRRSSRPLRCRRHPRPSPSKASCSSRGSSCRVTWRGSRCKDDRAQRRVIVSCCRRTPTSHRRRAVVILRPRIERYSHGPSRGAGPVRNT